MQVEGGAAAVAGAWVWRGFAGGVVVVAELFGAEARALAAAAVGEDVAALVLLFWLHLVSPPHGVFCVQSLRKTGDRSGLTAQSSLVFGLKAKARLWPGLCVFYLPLILPT